MRTKASDVYSFGMLLWEMLAHGEQPFMQYLSDAAALRAHVLSPINGRPPLRAQWHAEWKDLLRRCWASDVGTRGTFAAVISQLKLLPDP
jgi:hypothetical protein